MSDPFLIFDIQVEIIKFVSICDIVQLSLVNKSFNQCIKNVATWHMLLKRDFNISTLKNPETTYLKRKLRFFASQSQKREFRRLKKRLDHNLDYDTSQGLYYDETEQNLKDLSLPDRLYRTLSDKATLVATTGDPNLIIGIHNIILSHLQYIDIGLSALGLISEEKRYILRGSKVGEQFVEFIDRGRAFLTGNINDFSPFEVLMFVCENDEMYNNGNSDGIWSFP